MLTQPTLRIPTRIHNQKTLTFNPQHPPIYILRFRTTHRENLRYLKTLKIIDPDIKPHKIPSQDSISQILSMVHFLKSKKGFTDSDFPHLACLCPQLFSFDIDPVEIEPVFEFFAKELLATVEESRTMIMHCPALLLSDVEFCLRPTLSYLQELGLDRLNSPTSLNAYLLNTRIEKLVEKVMFLKRAGLTDEEAGRFCVCFLAIFRHSSDYSLRPKLEYLVRVMNTSVEELKEFPQYFGFSLEKRVMARHLHLMQRNAKMQLKSLEREVDECSDWIENVRKVFGEGP